MRKQIYWGATAGALIVSLALTAGKQYAASESNFSSFLQCRQQLIAVSEQDSESLKTQSEFARTIQEQKQRIAELEQALAAKTSAPMHNNVGGYIAACGALPGMVGDDC